MNNYKLKTMDGDQFKKVSEKAKEIAKEKDCIVEFEFNEITCFVSNKTVLEWLDRDYMNAHIMEWKTIGDDCEMMYGNDTEIELRTRQLERAKKWKREAEAQAVKDKAEEDIVSKQINGINISINAGMEEEYKKYVENNSSDGYGRAVIDYSEAWAKLMQIEISKGKKVKECAEETQKGLSYLGITGFQYGCVVNGLSHFWQYGEDLRKWHNKEYGVSEDKNGVVNPAIFTISQ